MAMTIIGVYWHKGQMWPKSAKAMITGCHWYMNHEYREVDETRLYRGLKETLI